MNEDKMIKLQQQMRENQLEFSDFLKDLDTWEADIKKKEEQLKSAPVEEQKLPPVRNSLEVKKKKRRKKKKADTETKTGEDKKSGRISGYDFRAWDKFDVDKALEEIDSRPDKSSSSSEYETDEEWEMERKRKMAVLEKEKGNQLFKEGKYEEAVQCYTMGMNADPENAVLPANRAMALLKLEKYAAAEVDCTSSLSLDPTYIKAFHRRGTARTALGKLQDAKHDFQQVLKLEPNNKQASSELNKIEEILNPKPSPSISAATPGTVKPVYKPPGQRSKKPLKRIEIEEIGADEEARKIEASIASIQATQSEGKRKVLEGDAKLFEKFTSATRLEEEKSSVLSHNGSLKSNDLKDTEHRHNLSKSPTELSPRKETRQSPRQNKNITQSSSTPSTVDGKLTSFQFQAEWKRLKNDNAAFFDYIKQVDPAKYPQLFGQSLEADMLMKMLTVFAEFFNKELNLFHHLKGLSEVKRFDMATMFMSPKEKKVTAELFEYMKSQGTASKEEIEKLAKKYHL
ncbi:RNA polymerase II-associated protein 3 [Lingula anatina]|uniref:RNA polymerase II-associated protein 3 n=1 Tax=Lingula anatina TaxID=7574 RepID=A0A1S3H238_LINAN|nr:RNA polymerase II-associated protein 3 [Lingula anatina]|eukprot:XP_013380007.1 RNA polymerase II-associated protein 3 [Lingula anatina]